MSHRDNITEEVRRAFYTRQRSAEVPLCIDDCVVVTSGKHQGRKATPISIESVGDDPVFLIEFGDTGEDAVLALSGLELVPEGEQTS